MDEIKFRINGLEPEEKLLLFKYLYKNEGDFYSQDLIVPDDEYEYVKTLVNPKSEEYRIPWDDVKFEQVEHLLNKVGIETPMLPLETKELTKEKQDLVDLWNRPRSIQMVETGMEVSEYFNQNSRYYNPEKDNFLLQLKLDGWNIQLYYIPGHHYPALITTRGRGGNTVECTGVLAHLMPPLNVNETTLISGELVLDKKILTHLRVKYNRPFKNSRNSISSIIHNTINVDEIKDNIRVYAFDFQVASGARYSNRLETLAVLEQIGFMTPPRLGLNNFNSDFYFQFNRLQDYYAKEFSQNWECDGAVICPIEYSAPISNPNEMYQDEFIAVKMGVWSKKFYHAKVKEIACPPSSGGAYRELTAIITPTETIDGRTIERVPLISVRRAKCGEGVTPVDIDDEIIFSYHSRQVVKFRGKDGIIYF